ncbi:MAG: DNA-formamidopyrimidine glycosylase [Firmicutes bacterium]|nr:DNA-formamidopyrimidine glycosylase [Candidatus Fiminaster equi]
MPELPEVETVKNILKEMTLGKKIKSVDVLRKQTIEGDADLFASSLIGETFSDFGRVGKFIIFFLTNNKVMISHLRMEGKYFLKDEKEKLTKHDLVVFHFTDGTKLIYNDTRRFGRIKLSSIEDYMKEEPLSKVGPDPFMMKDSKILEKAFKNKSIAIKTALLDQSIMSGLGNIYVDEVLFATKVHPETPAKLVSKKQLNEIWKASIDVLSNAIKAGGSTIKSYHPKQGISGNFQVNLKVYGKKDGTCPNCGCKLRKIFVNGRGTTYCPHCQKNPAIPTLIGVTGPIGTGKSTVTKYLEKHGYFAINTDEIVHILYKEKSIQNDIKKFIPNLKIKGSDIDRDFLRSYLIKNPNKKKRLEKYIHAKVVEQVEKLVKVSKKPCVIEAPLLFESGLDLICDKIIYVDAKKDTQIKHLESRKSDVKSSLELNKNYNTSNKKKATHIIINDKDVANLYKQVDSIFCK